MKISQTLVIGMTVLVILACSGCVGGGSNNSQVFETNWGKAQLQTPQKVPLTSVANSVAGIGTTVTLSIEKTFTPLIYIKLINMSMAPTETPLSVLSRDVGLGGNHEPNNAISNDNHKIYWLVQNSGSWTKENSGLDIPPGGTGLWRGYIDYMADKNLLVTFLAISVYADPSSGKYITAFEEEDFLNMIKSFKFMDSNSKSQSTQPTETPQVPALKQKDSGTFHATEVPVTDWTKIFEGKKRADGGFYSWGQSVQQTNDGGYVIAGTTDNYAWLIKTDASGNEVWNKTLGYGLAYSVQQTNDGGYITAGDSGSDALLIKTDASGNEVWKRIFGSTREDSVRSVQQTNDGGYIAAGEIELYSSENDSWVTHPWLIKTDASGNEVWNKTLGRSLSTILSSVQQTSDGGFITAGGSLLFKTDESGNEVWSKDFTGYAVNSVQQTSDGGFITAGKDADKARLLKTDTNGKQIWEKTFGIAGGARAYSVKQTSEGGYIIAGSTAYVSFVTSENDAWLIKTDASGNEVWNKTLGSGWLDNLNSVQQTDDGGYVTTGANGSVAWLIKIGADENTASVRLSTPEPSVDTQKRDAKNSKGTVIVAFRDLPILKAKNVGHVGVAFKNEDGTWSAGAIEGPGFPFVVSALPGMNNNAWVEYLKDESQVEKLFSNKNYDKIKIIEVFSDTDPEAAQKVMDGFFGRGYDLQLNNCLTATHEVLMAYGCKYLPSAFDNILGSSTTPISYFDQLAGAPQNLKTDTGVDSDTSVAAPSSDTSSSSETSSNTNTKTAYTHDGISYISKERVDENIKAGVANPGDYEEVQVPLDTFVVGGSTVPG